MVRTARKRFWVQVDRLELHVHVDRVSGIHSALVWSHQRVGRCRYAGYSAAMARRTSLAPQVCTMVANKSANKLCTIALGSSRSVLERSKLCAVRTLDNSSASCAREVHARVDTEVTSKTALLTLRVYKFTLQVHTRVRTRCGRLC